MASKTTLNAKNLEELGAARLAELLMELSAGDATAKRRLRLELAGTESPKAVAHEVRKRLATIARSRAFIDWQTRRALVDDLETQRRAIVEQIAKRDPREALDLLWRFLELANSVVERSDDRSGTVIGAFRDAVDDLGEIAKAAMSDPKALAERVYAALLDNDYGQYDSLVPALAPALGDVGLADLKERMVEVTNQPAQRPPGSQRQIVGIGTGSVIYADDIEERSRKSAARLALKDIADVQGDVDAFIAQYDEQARRSPRIAAEIARRLLAAGRAPEALEIFDAAAPGRRGWPDFAWEDARIEVLEALGCTKEAQAARWSCFERALSADHLRACLKRLPDFDDDVAERRAIEHALTYPSLLEALAFLASWPALEKAASLTVARAAELDGDHYEILTPAAEKLFGKHPLAATLLLRAMIDFALREARTSRYRHAARHLMECRTLASSIQDFGAFETHEAYVTRLRAEHGRKTSFWNLMS
ncbi:MAG: DUF6880 family protein [Pseudomonadota bacterium]